MAGGNINKQQQMRFSAEINHGQNAQYESRYMQMLEYLLMKSARQLKSVCKLE